MCACAISEVECSVVLQRPAAALWVPEWARALLPPIAVFYRDEQLAVSQQYGNHVALYYSKTILTSNLSRVREGTYAIPRAMSMSFVLRRINGTVRFVLYPSENLARCTSLQQNLSHYHKKILLLVDSY